MEYKGMDRRLTWWGFFVFTMIILRLCCLELPRILPLTWPLIDGGHFHYNVVDTIVSGVPVCQFYYNDEHATNWNWFRRFIFLLFERSQALDLYTSSDGNIRISYNNQDLLTVWNTPRTPGLLLQASLACRATGTFWFLGDVDAKDGQAIIKNVAPGR